MSRQHAEDGAFGYIAIAAIAIAALLQFLMPSPALENAQTQEHILSAGQPYYEVTYTFQRLPAECVARIASHSPACEAIRNAPPLVAEGWHAPEAAIIEIASAATP